MKLRQYHQLQKVSYKSLRKRIIYSIFAGLMSISIAGGWFLPLVNQDQTNKIGLRWTINDLVQRARADSLMAVSVDSMSQTTTTSLSVYTVKLNATSDNFTANHDYFVYWHMTLASSNASGMVHYQVKYGDSVEYTGAIEPSAGTANNGQQVSFIDVMTQPESAVAITVGFKNYTGHNYTASAFNASLVAMDLSDKTIANYDYYFDEDTTSYEHTTSPVSMASITLANADGGKDWLVFAMEDIAIDNAGQNAVADIYDGSTAYMTRTQEGEDADFLEQFTFVLYKAFDNTARGATYSIRVSDDGTPAAPATRNNHVTSRVFALSMEIFDKYSSTYASGSTALGTWTEVDTLSYTPNTTGNQVVFGGYTNAVAAANVQTNDRLTVDGTTPLPSGWDQTLSGGGKTSYDATDYTTSNLLTVVSMNTNAHTIDIDASEIFGNSQVAKESAIIAFSTLYKYIPRVNKWRWYGDEGDTTPDTAYAAENTAPPQEEIGKSIAFKLRVNLTEVGNAAENNNRKKLYYATGTTGPWTIMGETTDTDKAWRYYNGGGADNGILDGVVLTGSSSGSKGIYNESNSDSPSNSDHPAGTTVEFEYCIENYSATANTAYYFGLFDQTAGLIPPVSGDTANLPTLTTAAAYDLSVSAPSSVDLGDFVIGSRAYHEYAFVGGEEITARDNRGQTSGNSSGWSLAASVSGELTYSEPGSIGNVGFTGSGLNDMHTAGTFTGSNSTTYTITVILTGTPDVGSWTDTEGGGGTVPFVGGDGSPFPLSLGIEVYWDATTGHTVTDEWEFTCTPGPTHTITDDNTYWISDSITGLYAAPTTNISTQSGDYMGSAVTASSVVGNAKDGLGGFTLLPTLRLYGIDHIGIYTGSFTLTLT